MKIGALYYEKAVADHPRTVALRRQLARLPQIAIDGYGEIFNRGGSNFRLQKQRPSLILARKYEGFVLPTPPTYGIGAPANFYFSHLMNCPYDCRYCFLQGMYRSAHYVLFVNYEDFFSAVADQAAETPKPSCFFSGYDCDSLALEGLTGFAAAALPFFRELPEVWLELRTKSTAPSLVGAEPWPRCVVAFSLSPASLSAEVEHGTPPLARRLAAMRRLAAAGWPLGLRFDPVWVDPAWPQSAFFEVYRAFFREVAATIPIRAIHSISLGSFRLPQPFYRRLAKLYPDDRLVSGTRWALQDGQIQYPPERDHEMLAFCADEIAHHWPPEVYFPTFSTNTRPAATG